MENEGTGTELPRARRHSPFCIHHSAFRIRRGAFTLLELIVVLLVLSILFAMAAPSMSGFGAGRAASQTASQIVSLARWAREQAVSEGRTYRLNFLATNADGPVYFVTAADGAIFDRIPVEFGRNFSVPEGVAVEFDTPQVGGVPSLDFFASGRCEPGHIRIASRDGAVTDLACLSATEPLRVVTADELREATLR
jgi:prepilin-type N-terminal cleavage/methylation domain-containing protein